MKCRECGAPIANGETICSQCGKSIKQNADSGNNRNPSSGIIFGSLLAITLVLAGASLFLKGWILPPQHLQTSVAVTKNPSSEGQYFLWEIYDPDTGEVGGIIVRIDTYGKTTVMSFVEDDGSIEEVCEMDGSPSSGSMNLTAGEDDWNSSVGFIENPDGSWSAFMDVQSEEGYGTSLSKLLPVEYAGGDRWKILTTGETVTYDDIYEDRLTETKAGSQFKKEAEPFASYTEIEQTPDPKPSVITPSSTPASSGKHTSDTAVPDDVMRVYVTYEVENIEHEYNGVPVSNHIKMPNEAEQKRFEALIEDELWGDRLTFWRENKDSWYR